MAKLTFGIQTGCASVAARGASALKVLEYPESSYQEMGLEYMSKALDYVRDKVANVKAEQGSRATVQGIPPTGTPASL